MGLAAEDFVHLNKILHDEAFSLHCTQVRSVPRSTLSRTVKPPWKEAAMMDTPLAGCRMAATKKVPDERNNKIFVVVVWNR